MYYVVATDAPCGICGHVHGVATKGCNRVCVWADWATAKMVARKIEGAAVKQVDLDDVVAACQREGGSIILYQHKFGQPDPKLPRTNVELSSPAASLRTPEGAR
jgi:hypothetical protein